MHVVPAEARRREIRRRLVSGQPVNASALAREFLISEDAVRRDLRALAAEGKCKRIYGGALPLSPEGVPFHQRLMNDTAGKRALASEALPLIADLQTVFLDSGSTNLALAQQLPLSMNVTFATNSAVIAATLLERQVMTVIMIGGEIDREEGAAVGPSSIREAERLNFDLCFLGTCAVSTSIGVSAFKQPDAEFKRTLVANSDRVAALVTMDKVETRAPFQVASIAALDYIVLERGISEDIISAFSASGPSVSIAG